MKKVILPGLVLLALSIPTLAARSGTRKLDGRFERADLDANGELTDIEFRATQSKKASIALSLHRFNYTDVNDDGIVTLTEFRASRGGVTGGKPNKAETFILCDADDSLTLDPEEYSNSRSTSTPWTKVLKGFDKQDKDDDALLTTREFGIRRFPL